MVAYARFRSFMDPAPTISTHGLTRRFGELVAVDGIDLRVAPGQFFGFLGPNGAGKSTTIKMLTGLLAPTSGRIEILGLDLTAHTDLALHFDGVGSEIEAQEGM